MAPAFLAAEVTDPLAVVLAAGSAVITTLLGIVIALVGARNSRNETDIKELRREVNELTVTKATQGGELNTAKADIEGLKRGTLTEKQFLTETAAQNRILEEQNRDLDVLRQQNAELARKVEKLRDGLGARPTRSEMSMPAARPPARRTDGPSDSEPPSDPPPPIQPPRPKLPSRPGRY